MTAIRILIAPGRSSLLRGFIALPHRKGGSGRLFVAWIGAIFAGGKSGLVLPPSKLGEASPEPYSRESNTGKPEQTDQGEVSHLPLSPFVARVARDECGGQETEERQGKRQNHDNESSDAHGRSLAIETETDEAEVAPV